MCKKKCNLSRTERFFRCCISSRLLRQMQVSKCVSKVRHRAHYVNRDVPLLTWSKDGVATYKFLASRRRVLAMEE